MPGYWSRAQSVGMFRVSLLAMLVEVIATPTLSGGTAQSKSAATGTGRDRRSGPSCSFLYPAAGYLANLTQLEIGAIVLLGQALGWLLSIYIGC